MNFLYKMAVKYLCYCLKKDGAMWYAWQSNISMIINDRYNRYFPLTTRKNSPTFHGWCNICANDFLNLLTDKRK